MGVSSKGEVRDPQRDGNEGSDQMFSSQLHSPTKKVKDRKTVPSMESIKVFLLEMGPLSLPPGTD